MIDSTDPTETLVELLETQDEQIPAQDVPSHVDRIIYETTLVHSHKGVRGCGGHRDWMVLRLVEVHAALKAKETGMEPVWKGHNGGSVQVRSGRPPFGGGRWCTITVVLKCVAIFEKAAQKDDAAAAVP